MSRQSKFLSNLRAGSRELIQPHLHGVTLKKGDVVARPYSKLEMAFFPTDVTFAVDIELAKEASFFTGLIGSDGLLGAGLSLDDRVCLYSVTALNDGHAFALPMKRLRDFLLQLPDFRKRSLAYDQYFLAQVQQAAACGALHELSGRLCSLLLRLNSLVGTELSLTQNDLGQMLGVRRTSVSECASELQAAGAIGYRRGKISVLKTRQLGKLSCGCNRAISDHYSHLFSESFDET